MDSQIVSEYTSSSAQRSHSSNRTQPRHYSSTTSTTQSSSSPNATYQNQSNRSLSERPKQSPSSGLSELDALMSDLEAVRRSTAGGPTVRTYEANTEVTHTFTMSKDGNGMSMSDNSRSRSYRDDRDEVSGSPMVTRPKSPGSQRKVQPSASSPRQARANTSNATQELDDLMASLSDFRVNESSNTTREERHYREERQQREERSYRDSPGRFSDTDRPNRDSPGRFSDSPAATYPRPTSGRDEPWQQRAPSGQTPVGDRSGSRASDTSDNSNSCAGCDKTINGQECRKPFESGSFFDYEGKPYCETDYHTKRGSICGNCNQPVSGRCITAMGRKFHPDHFVCSYCVRPLNKGTFKEHQNKPWCHICFERLWGSKKDGDAGDNNGHYGDVTNDDF